MRQQDPLPRKPKQPQSPAVPFDPNNPSTWPKATPSNLAELQAKAGYRPLTGKKPATTPWYKVNPFSDENRRYDLSGKNMYNASGTDALKFASNLITGAADLLIDEPVKSLGRTLSTQNIQTAINPKSTATERINAVGEDVLNLFSIIPAGRAAVEGAGPIKQGVKNYLTSLAEKRAAAKAGNTWTPFLLPYEEASPRLAAARLQEAQAAHDLEVLKDAAKPRPGVIESPGMTQYNARRPQWDELIPEGYERFWHTNPKGEALPPKLQSMEEAARLSGRRGTGATQAFSGGIYNTNAGDMSLTYLDETGAPIVMDRFPSSVLPKRFVDDLMPGYGIYDRPWMGVSRNFYGEDVNFPQIAEEIRGIQLDDFKNQFVGLNSSANSIPFRAGSPFKGQDFGNMTVKELLDSAATKEEALAIINDSTRPIVFEFSPSQSFGQMTRRMGNRNLDYRTREAMLNQEVRFKHPIVRGPKGSYSKTAVLGPDSSLYLAPWNNFSPAEMPFSEGYYQKIEGLSAKWKADAIKRTQDMFAKQGLTPDQIARRMDQSFFQYLDETNPYTYFQNRELQPKFQMGMRNFGGQNYWDLPVVRDANDVIQSIAGLKAMDIRTAGGSKEMFENLANEWRDFISTNYPELSNNQGINNQLKALRDLHTSKAKTKGYFQVQNELDNLIKEFNRQKGMEFDPFGGLTPKEQFYEHLNNKGYGVIPHTGGEITGGDVAHLALNFLKPELLPPSTYVPGTVNFDDALARLARARAQQTRMVKSTMDSAPYSEAMHKAALDKFRGRAVKTGGQLVASSNLQRIGGY